MPSQSAIKARGFLAIYTKDFVGKPIINPYHQIIDPTNFHLQVNEFYYEVNHARTLNPVDNAFGLDTFLGIKNFGFDESIDMVMPCARDFIVKYKSGIYLENFLKLIEEDKCTLDEFLNCIVEIELPLRDNRDGCYYFATIRLQVKEYDQQCNIRAKSIRGRIHRNNKIDVPNASILAREIKCSYYYSNGKKANWLEDRTRQRVKKSYVPEDSFRGRCGDVVRAYTSSYRKFGKVPTAEEVASELKVARSAIYAYREQIKQDTQVILENVFPNVQTGWSDTKPYIEALCNLDFDI